MTDNAEHVRVLEELAGNPYLSECGRAAITAAIAALKGPDAETMRFAYNAAHLLRDFMLNTNEFGPQRSGVILARGIKAYLASQPPKESE